MMFLDCPAYLDEDGARRCGLAAELRCRYVLHSSGAPLGAATIRCPSGHWFNGPIESLTWESEEKHHPGKAGIIARGTLLDGRSGAIARGHPGQPWREIARLDAAPAYYLGRPARMWITAMSPRRRRKPTADAQNPIGNEQTPNPAYEPSQALA